LLVSAVREAKSGNVITSSHSSIATTSLTPRHELDSEVSEPVVQLKRLRIMDDFEDEDPDSDIIVTATQYLSSNEKPIEAKRADSLRYWKNSKFSALALIAQTYLTIGASFVPCDSMFSISGLLLNGRHSSLAPHSFNWLIFLQDNDKLRR
jgi:hAT family C-terminal dimerisation region